MKGGRHSVGSIFAVPLIIAILSIVGLISALTGDGWRDAVSWAGLLAPILAVGWAVGARRS